METASVIIPTYNRADLLPRAINSVLSQDYPAIEVLVLDDGSTDNTRDVLEPYISSKKIRYFRMNHGGAQAARIFGMKQATGKYFFFLDSDDEFTPQSISKRVKVLEKVGCDALVYGDCIINGKRSFATFFGNGFIYKKMLKRLYCAAYYSIAITRGCVEKSGFPSSDFPACQDDDFELMIAKHCPFYYLKFPVALVGLTKNSIWRSPDSRYKGNQMLFEKYREEILKYHGRIGVFFGRVKLLREKLYCNWLFYSGKKDFSSVFLRKFNMALVLMLDLFLHFYYLLP